MPASPELFADLIDDAAVFPPGNAPLEVALRRHQDHRRAGHAPAIGPLLVPASASQELIELLEGDSVTEPLGFGVIGRPGTDPALVADAVDRLHRSDRVRLVGAELGWLPDWRDLGLSVPLALEVARDVRSGQGEQLADIAAGGSVPVLAKFRTGATATWPWPDETELAGFLARATWAGVRFKLTGGLHHAVRDDHPDPQHGLLNVLAASHALADGATLDHAERLLQIRDAGALAAVVGGWDRSAVELARRHLASYGCCEVTDPLADLADLGLLPDSYRKDLR